MKTSSEIERVHLVLLSGAEIGRIHHKGDVSRLILSEDYWNSPHRNVLGLWFEDNPGASPKAALRLPIWFSNLLPEGNLRTWLANERGVNKRREIEVLLQLGRDLPGAVEVVEDGGSGELGKANLVVPEALPQSVQDNRWKFSLAGVGLKFSMLLDGGRLTMPASDAVGDWIVKLPDAVHRDVPLNEFTMMSLAGAVGIDVPAIRMVGKSELAGVPASAWLSNETEAYAVSRFDRTANGGRIHIEDFAQVRGFYPDDKYVGAFDTVAALVYRNRQSNELQEFVRRLTLNLLIGNGDAHLKNWSLIYRDGRRPALAPAYDLVCTACYVKVPDREDFGLKLSGTKVMERIDIRSFERLQDRLNAHNVEVAATVHETVTRFHSAWSDLSNTRVGASVFGGWISQNLPAVAARLGNRI